MQFDKVIRDPIHGFVGLTGEEVRIIDAPLFQRLRRIKQLALTNYVFPGAVHTRFEHSLGTLHLTHRILRRLVEIGSAVTDEQERAVRLAALLHDVGHGPFSHVAENFITFPEVQGSRVGHAKASFDIIRLHRDLEFLGEIRELAASLMADWVEPRTFLRDIVSSPLDADKMDYLLRDSHFSGVRYGITDTERIVFTLQGIDDLGGGGRSFLGVSAKGREAVESLILARYFMHNQVYLHHTRLACDAMISRAVSMALRDGGIDSALFHYKTDGAYLDEYLKLTDDSFLDLLATSASEHAKNIVTLLRLRRPFKRVYNREVAEFPDARLKSLLSELTAEDMLKYEREIAEEAKLEPEYVVLARQELTKPTYRGAPSKDILDVKTILVVGNEGIPRELEDISPIFSTIGQRAPASISCYVDIQAGSTSQAEERRKRIRESVTKVVEAIGR